MPGVGECVRDQMVVGGTASAPSATRPGRGFAQPPGERGERVGTGEVGVAQRQVVRMHGRAAMRQEAGRLEQRQPGAQSGGDVVRGRGDRGLEPGHGVLGAGQRNEERLGAGGGAARCLTGRRIRVLPGLPEPIVVLVHRGPPGAVHAVSAADPKPLMHRSRKRQDGSKTPLPFRISGNSGPDLR